MGIGKIARSSNEERTNHEGPEHNRAIEGPENNRAMRMRHYQSEEF
jgi:hypothetical protein